MFDIKYTENKISSDLLIIPLFAQEKLFSAKLEKSFSVLTGITQFVKEHPDFQAKNGEYILFNTNDKKHPRVLLVGLGKEADLTAECFRKAGGLAFKRCSGLKIQTASCAFLDAKAEQLLTPFVEGFLLASYNFDSFRSKKKEINKQLTLLNLVLDRSATKTDLSQLEETKNIVQAIFRARDLVNTPANALNPDTFVTEAKKMLKGSRRLKMKVVDLKQLKKLGAGAILGVGQGSKHPPRFIVIEYKSKSKKAATLALVGKGITFDTGGIHLKPTGAIETMKLDMAGAASVLATMSILTKHDVPVNLVAILAIAENAIGENAMRPGDVLTSYSGKTIEITNTDAEGRLVLADAVAYVQDKYKVDGIIDLATLTGACLVALGHHIAAVLTNSDALLKKIQTASTISGEKVWQLPLDHDLQKAVKGSFTDLVNFTKSVQAGSIMGGCFIHAFIKNDLPWAHLDIAGTGWTDQPGPYTTRGGTGTMIRMLWELLKGYK